MSSNVLTKTSLSNLPAYFADCGDCACQLQYAFDNAYTFQSVPKIFSLELTSACNNRCSGCGNVDNLIEARKAPLALSASQWDSVLDKITPVTQHLKITGGEPTLHPEFSTIITNIIQRHLRFTLFTNGRWQKPQAIIKLLKDSPECLGMLISLHGIDAPSHTAFVGVEEAFKETIINIQHAVRAGIRVATSTVLTKYNASRIEAFVDFALELGVDHVVFNRYLGEHLPEIEPSLRELQSAVCTIEALAARGVPVRYGNPIPQHVAPNSSHGCLAGISYCTIDPEGNMRPCNHDATIIGSILTQSMEVLWRSECMQVWRKTKGDVSVEDCKIYPYRNSGEEYCECLSLARLQTPHPPNPSGAPDRGI